VTETKGPPFTLPPLPVDRYEVEWYEVDLTLYTVTPCRGVYHVNSSWEEVMGERRPGERPGVPFVNHWQIFRNGRFTGRTRDGWLEPWLVYDWSNDYGTRKSARGALRKAIWERIQRLDEELAELHRTREVLDEEAWNEWEETHPEAKEP
jgi:hypothetical protein